MARIFLVTSVEDYAKWRAVYDTDIARRDSMGLRQIGVYREADHLDEIVIVFDIDRSAAEAKTLFAERMADAEFQAIMKKSGVKAPPKAWILD